jgi:hypothetical protein
VLAKNAQTIVGRTYLVFSALTWGEMNTSCWLAENNIILRDVTDKFQLMAIYGNDSTTANASKDGDDGA